MNKRIRELAEQAEILITQAGAFHNTPQGAYQLQEQHMNKFAELIVRECADTVLGFHNQFGDSAHDEIREHFGVER
jgi:hypothetical protein